MLTKGDKGVVYKNGFEFDNFKPGLKPEKAEAPVADAVPAKADPVVGVNASKLFGLIAGSAAAIENAPTVESGGTPTPVAEVKTVIPEGYISREEAQQMLESGVKARTDEVESYYRDYYAKSAPAPAQPTGTAYQDEGDPEATANRRSAQVAQELASQREELNRMKYDSWWSGQMGKYEAAAGKHEVLKDPVFRDLVRKNVIAELTYNNRTNVESVVNAEAVRITRALDERATHVASLKAADQKANPPGIPGNAPSIQGQAAQKPLSLNDGSTKEALKNWLMGQMTSQ